MKLLLIFVSAKVFAEVFAYLKIPSVLGEVVAGIIIGPSLLGFIDGRTAYSQLEPSYLCHTWNLGYAE